ncbi:hypothetical protein DCAR_0417522 [Daucus carota subsp. sativus]|uniref:COMM domain-containing protein n=1 Tax=Daucus carota subsp. sativus TaxID=79200 RepID=A0AAF0X072_DAUCS|nr:PREDICTED: uncharacterized protein LOC108216597 [Daucus carota subsp. sativus]WOG98181.1 hypothetical protein DCAR_0417522 [Daucus carota subsp. sativus]
MEEEKEQLYQHLHKLTPLIESQTQLEELVKTLWSTRKTGLSPAQKSHFQSLLTLPNLSALSPVLACLRSLIRKCAQENFVINDISKLFPPDLPLDLQRSLVVIFQRCQNQWKEDLSVTQTQSPRTKFPSHTIAGMPQPSTCFRTSEYVASPRPLNLLAGNDSCNNIGASVPVITDINLSPLASMPPEQGAGTDNLGTPPRLKSMTWTVDNQSKARRNKVAVINLKLQDYTQSPLRESEVKFQLTRETVDSMLKSMTQINEQFSTHVGSSSGTVSKK